MTIRLQGNLIEVEDQELPESNEAVVVVRIKDGQNWNGNTYWDCKLALRRQDFKEASVAA